MKNKPVIIAVAIIFLVFITLSTFLYHLYKLRPYLAISENPEVLKHFPAKFSYDDTNVSSYITQSYYPNNDTKEIIKKTESLFPTQKELFLPDSEKKIQPYIEEIVPNNLEKFVSSFIKYNIKHDIERSKNLKKELADYEKYAHPLPITFETTKLTAEYWYLISRYLDNFGDSESSLLLSQGIYYLARDWEREYYYGSRALNKTQTFQLCHIACNSILVWANKPRPDKSELSKKIAADILDLVNTEFPLAVNIKYERRLFDAFFKENDFKHFQSKACEFLNTYVTTSKSYFKVLDEVYKTPLEFIDKPIYELNNEFEDYNNKIKTLFGNRSNFGEILKLLKDPDEAITIILLKRCLPDFETMKKHTEQKLAEMELTAIALVINAFAAENKKMPESIAELSKWFGRELPKDRLTNKPYELNLKGKHILYNKGINGIEDLDSKDTDDIYFDFSL